MKIVHYLWLIPILSLLTYCEETFDWDTNNQEKSLLVVEGLLTNEKKRHQVKLSLTRNQLTATPEFVDDAFVFINDGDTTIRLTKDPDLSGVYRTDSMRAVFGKVYTLFIVHDQKEYFSISASAFGAPIEPLITTETADGQLAFFYQESLSPSMTELEIWWPDNPQANEPDVRAYYYTLDVIDINKVFAPDKEDIIFPRGSRVVRKKFSLTQNHQDFLRSVLSETDWRGGLFDVAPGNVRTNLSEGAVGYFAVSMVGVDITFAE